MSPYIEHPVFKNPDDPNVKIWRYMDFTELVSLLDKKALYFTRADILAEKFDKNECLCPTEYVESIKQWTDEELKKRILNQLTKEKDFRKNNFINCWHINDVESAAMWKIYSNRGYGVAIQSRFNRLVDSFKVFKNDVFIGKVAYYPKEIQFSDNLYHMYLIKRKCFEYEKELRALISNGWTNSHEGEYIPVDLGILLENIYLAPNTENWIYELTKSILAKYNVDVPIHHSTLDHEPY